MGCFEKVLGLIIGIIGLFIGIVLCADGVTFNGIWAISSSIIFIILCWFMSYEVFFSFLDSLDTSEFSGIISKTILVALISAGIGWLCASIINLLF